MHVDLNSQTTPNVPNGIDVDILQLLNDIDDISLCSAIYKLWRSCYKGAALCQMIEATRIISKFWLFVLYWQEQQWFR